MKTLNNKGQAGVGGEDLMHIILAILAITAVLVIVVKTFADHENRHVRLDMYRSALIKAGKISTDLSWQSNGVKHTRVLDEEKLASVGCGSLCGGRCGVKVIDRTDGTNKLSCPGSMDSYSLGKITIRLPVSIRLNEKEFHPGILALTVAR